jgi:hypothetical protein
MSFAAQVWHVMQWDLRARWPALAMVAVLLALGIWQVATFGGDADAGFRAPLGALAVLAAILTSAQFVIDHRAADPRAFWRGLPLRATAVAVAKILLSMGLTLVIAVVAWGFLTTRGMSPTQAFATVASDAPIMVTGVVLTLLLGSLARGLGGFLLIVVGVGVLFVLTQILNLPWPLTVNPRGAVVLTVLATVASVSAVFWRYRQRHDGWRARSVPLSAAALAIYTPWLADRVLPPITTPPQVALADSLTCDRGRVWVSIQSTAAEPDLLVLSDAHVFALDSAGTRHSGELPVIRGWWLTRSATYVPMAQGRPLRSVRARRVAEKDEEQPETFQIRRDGSATAVPCERVAGIAIEGEITRYKATEFVSLPAGGGRVTVPGAVVTLDPLRAGREGAMLRVTAWSHPPGAGVAERGWMQTLFLVHDARGEYRSVAAESNGGEEPVGLPGVIAQRNEARLDLRRNQDSTLTDEWLAGARLVVIRPRAVEAGPFRMVRAPIRVVSRSE